MTPSNFFNAQKGVWDAHEVKEQSEWERTRWLACVILNPHVKKSLKPKDLTTFPWESARKTSKSYEEVYKEAELFSKISEMKKKKKKTTHG